MLPVPEAKTLEYVEGLSFDLRASRNECPMLCSMKTVVVLERETQAVVATDSLPWPLLAFRIPFCLFGSSEPTDFHQIIVAHIAICSNLSTPSSQWSSPTTLTLQHTADLLQSHINPPHLPLSSTSVPTYRR